MYLPSLHITVGFMKIFVKALDREEQAFAYLRNTFPKLSDIKVKEGIFIGPEIWEFMQDLYFHCALSLTEKAAWNAVNSVCTNFLGSHKAENFREIVSEMLQGFQVMKCCISSILIRTFSPQSFGEVSDEHGWRFHQDILIMEIEFVVRWHCGMLQNAVVCSERTRRMWLQKKKIKTDFSHLSTCIVICIDSVKNFCINN